MRCSIRNFVANPWNKKLLNHQFSANDFKRVQYTFESETSNSLYEVQNFKQDFWKLVQFAAKYSAFDIQNFVLKTFALNASYSSVNCLIFVLKCPMCCALCSLLSVAGPLARKCVGVWWPTNSWRHGDRQPCWNAAGRVNTDRGEIRECWEKWGRVFAIVHRRTENCSKNVYWSILRCYLRKTTNCRHCLALFMRCTEVPT